MFLSRPSVAAKYLLNVDFEDGSGNRPDDKKAATAVHADKELAIGKKNKTDSPFTGILIKPLPKT